MALTTSILINAIILVGLGALLLFKISSAERIFKGFLRSKQATFVLFGAASIWFLYDVANLGEADFGQYKGLLLLLFGATAILSFFFVEDFLSVRGLSALLLLSARCFLDSAYMIPSTTKLIFVSYVYIIITLALIIGGMPFCLRDFFNWVFSSAVKAKTLGTVMAITGVTLMISIFFL